MGSADDNQAKESLMTSITASDLPIKGKTYTKLVFDEWEYMTKPMNTNINDYEIRRLGRKDYGVFCVRAWADRIMFARYKCSHLEARRRWAMVLVTKRLRA